MSGNFNPSKALVTKALLKNLSGTTEEITALIGGFEIKQSIASTAWNIVLSVGDSIGLLEGAREFGELKGEEEIELEIQCMDSEPPTRVTLNAYVIRIDNVQPMGSGRGLFYDMHLISKTTFEASTKRVTSAFKERTASKVAQEIFSQYYGKMGGTGNMAVQQLPYPKDVRKSLGSKAVYFEESADTLSLATIIPNLPSAAAMQFVANRSYSEKSKSSSFRFFETLTSYFWVSDEWLIEFGKRNPARAIPLVYNPISSLDPRDKDLMRKTIENMYNDKRVSDMDDIHSGGYKNRAFIIDLLRGKVEDKTFEYKPGEFVAMGGGSITNDTHTNQWINKYTTKNNAQRFFVYKDYKEKNPGVNRPNQFHAEIVSQRLKHEHHINYMTATAKLKGRLDIEPGMIVDVKASKMSNVETKEGEENKRLSGNYLVHSTNHTMMNNVLETQLTLIRYMSEK